MLFAGLGRSALAWAALVAPPSPDGLVGFTTEKHADLGLSFPVPLGYEPLPTQPDEAWIVLAYGEKLPDERARRKEIRPELSIAWIDHVPDAPAIAPAPGEGAGPAPPASGPLSAPPRPVNSLERWIERCQPSWQLGPAVEGKEREGWRSREHTLVPRRGAEPGRGGWVYAWSSARRTIAVLGTCSFADLKEQVKLWRTTAERMQFGEPEGEKLESLQKLYAGASLIDPARRIDVRRKLVRGWKAEDTEHFIVVYDTSDQPLVRKVCRDLEALRGKLLELFPPARDVQAVSTVRLCRSRDEYLAFQGSPSTAGYWNADTGELVLYDARRERKEQVGDDSDTFIVLYHEAFHQFIHHSAGELPPHPWFNEGHGDYFSGLVMRAGSVVGIGVNPWRVEAIKDAVARRATIPWKDIVRCEQKAFLQDPLLAYAQSWSMVYFLRTSPEVQRRPEWARILPVYFDTLKSAWAEELARLVAAGQGEDKLARWQAGHAARARAADAAFEGIDLEEIEKAWREFVLHVEPPRKG